MSEEDITMKEYRSMDSLEKFLNELRDALIGSELPLMLEIPLELGVYIKPPPFEADRVVGVVRDMFTHGGWKAPEEEAPTK